jgi:hypothetical protein
MDQHLVSSTAFGLCDSTSLLWRAELVTGEAASPSRWAALARRWAAIAERHTCGFIDLHAALAFAAQAGSDAEVFWSGLAARLSGETFNDVTFAEVVAPLVRGIRAHRSADHDLAQAELASVRDSLRRVGGSVLQRDIVARTAARAREMAGLAR